MPITGLSDFIEKYNTTWRSYPITKNSTSTVSLFRSTWTAVGTNVGTIPSTSVACDSNTQGSLVNNLTSTNTLVLMGIEISGGNASGSTQGGHYMVCDRLVHGGGLNYETTGTFTTNLPTASLPRYTSGHGVMIGLEVFSTVSTSAVINATVEYTNSDGISGRNTKLVPISSATAATRNLQNIYMLPLDDGDTGVLSVESVTFTGTGNGVTAGNVGVVLFKPLYNSCGHNLYTSSYYRNGESTLFDGSFAMPVIENDACLWIISSNAGAAGGFLMSLVIGEI